MGLNICCTNCQTRCCSPSSRICTSRTCVGCLRCALDSTKSPTTASYGRTCTTTCTSMIIRSSTPCPRDSIGSSLSRLPSAKRKTHGRKALNNWYVELSECDFFTILTCDFYFVYSTAECTSVPDIEKLCKIMSNATEVVGSAMRTQSNRRLTALNIRTVFSCLSTLATISRST